MNSVQDVSPDLQWCYDAVQDVSRTFALTVDALSEPMASHIGLGYLLCRVADTIEDAGHIPPMSQVSLLRSYDRALDPDEDWTVLEFRELVDAWIPSSDERSDDWDVVARSPTLWATFLDQSSDVQEAIIPPVREMIGGMAGFLDRYADAGGLRIGTFDELEEYCYYAAGTVGVLITNLHTRTDVSRDRSETLYDTAESFALLLQLVNIAKDVREDFVTENNVYLPAEWLAKEDVEQEEIFEEQNHDAVVRVIRKTANHARTFLDDAQTYLETMPLVSGNTLAAWSVPFLLSVGTLRELDNRPADALSEGGVKVSRQEVIAIMSAAMHSGSDSLGDLRSRIARTPFHEIIG